MQSSSALLIFFIQTFHLIRCQQQGSLNFFSPTIVNGANADPFEWRWYIRLSVGSALCGGALVSEQFVITARHCLCENDGVTIGSMECTHFNGGVTDVSQMIAIAGDYYLFLTDPGEVQRRGVNVWIHPDGWDIAILQIQPVELSSWISVIPLAAYGPDQDQKVWAAGFGLTDPITSSLPLVLQEIELDVMAPCSFPNPSPTVPLCDTCICAQSQNTTVYSNICLGDSGGPLMIKRSGYRHWELVGVTSATAGAPNALYCTTPTGYGIFPSIAGVRDWIDNIISLRLTRRCLGYDDPFYYSYDGTNVEYQGSCEIIMSQWCNSSSVDPTLGIPQFQVLSQNDKCYPSPDASGWWPSCMGKVTLVLPSQNFQVTLDRSDTQDIVITVDGTEISVSDLPKLYVFDEFFVEIYINPAWPHGISLETSFGLQLLHIKYVIAVRLHQWLATATEGSLCGLCGQHNYIRGDDYTLSDGTQYIPFSENVDHEVLDQEYYDAYIPDNNNPPGCETTNHNAATKRSVKQSCSGSKMVYAESVCRVIKDPEGPFQSCYGLTKQRDIGYSNCISAVCFDKKFKCSSLQGYAAVCGQSPGLVGNWRDAAGCPVKCRKHQVYSPSTSSECLPTCRSPNPCGESGIPANGVTSEGCICKAGYVWDGESCINKNICGIKLSGRKSIKSGKCNEPGKNKLKCLIWENLDNPACRGLYGKDKMDCVKAAVGEIKHELTPA